MNRRFSEELIIGIIFQHLNGPCFDCVALCDEASALCQHHTEHGYGCQSSVFDFETMLWVLDSS